MSQPAASSLQSIPELTKRLTGLHRELGIPASYAVDRGLEPHFEAAAAGLVEVALNPEGRSIRLIRPAAAAWAGLQRRAAVTGILLIPISGFRSVERQAEIIREKTQAGRPLDDILRFVAAPGFSEHHTGRAIDISSPDHIELDEEFEGTPAFRWLNAHAEEFGFRLSYPRHNLHGIGYEPWHWCWH